MTLHFILGLQGSLAAVSTYALHAAIWACATALLVRFCAFSASVRSHLWLAALLGPLLSAALALSVSSSRTLVSEIDGSDDP